MKLDFRKAIAEDPIENTGMKRKILFVDDEQNVLTGLKRMLRVMREEWEMAFIDNAEGALLLLEKQPFDVVVTDIRMPGMDGLDLLRRIKDKYPQILRIVLSGESNTEILLKSTSVSHQYLSKPCSAEIIKNVISRAYSLNNLLSDDGLKKTLARMDSLPSMPSLYGEIVSMLNSPNSSLKQIGEIISRDIGMSAKILQLVNSAYFGLSREISNPVQAVSLIGMNTIKSLVLSIHIFSWVDPKTISWLSMDDLWKHNMLTGLFAKAIVKSENQDHIMIDNAFLAGLLHDSGKLILAMNFPDKYRDVIALMADGKLDILESERRMFDTTHAESGAYLLGVWGLPVPVVEAIAYHHEPCVCEACFAEGFGVLTAVHAADRFARSIKSSPSLNGIDGLDMHYLEKVDCGQKVEFWYDVCMKVFREEMLK